MNSGAPAHTITCELLVAFSDPPQVLFVRRVARRHGISTRSEQPDDRLVLLLKKKGRPTLA